MQVEFQLQLRQLEETDEFHIYLLDINTASTVPFKASCGLNTLHACLCHFIQLDIGRTQSFFTKRKYQSRRDFRENRLIQRIQDYTNTKTSVRKQ